ncbi:MAG: hypothetical protein IKU47_05600 [Oscillospiraceae bacterium]|nr:hypothetical protein [Oscillospiraceae bacterium]
MKILGIVVAAVIVAAVFAFGAKGGRQRTVGTDILLSEVTEFYYTTAASANPASRQQYRFYMEGEQWWFSHEARQGSHWPLTEKDITACGAKQLSQQEYEQFTACISGGKVTKRTENADSGGRGPWLYLYWKGDKGKYQQFSFADYAAQTAFEQFCAALAAQ